MKRKILTPGKIIFSFLLIVLALSTFPHPTQARIVNRIMAIVGNQVITSMNLRQAISVGHPLKDFETLPVEEQNNIIKKELDGLVDNLLIAQKAASLGISITDADIEATIERILEQNHMSQEMLEKALATQNLDFTSYRNKIASDLLMAKFVSREVKANIIITKQEIFDYAEKHDLFSRDESVTLAQIFIPTGSPNATLGEDNEIWKKIQKRLKNEENFFALASEFSEGPAAAKGGRLGTFKRGSLLPEIEEVVYKLPLGEASKVIMTSLGNHMVMVTNRTGEKEENSLSPAAEEQIKEQLYEEKLEKTLKNLGQDLRREYSVKIMQ